MFALFIPALWGALATMMASLVWRAVFALGIGFVTYTGITVAVDSIKQSVITGVSSLPADALSLVGYLWLDKGLTIIFSAVATTMTLKLVGGSVKKMVFK